MTAVIVAAVIAHSTSRWNAVARFSIDVVVAHHSRMQDKGYHCSPFRVGQASGWAEAPEPLQGAVRGGRSMWCLFWAHVIASADE